MKTLAFLSLFFLTSIASAQTVGTLKIGDDLQSIRCATTAGGPQNVNITMQKKIMMDGRTQYVGQTAGLSIIASFDSAGLEFETTMSSPLVSSANVAAKRLGWSESTQHVLLGGVYEEGFELDCALRMRAGF